MALFAIEPAALPAAEAIALPALPAAEAMVLAAFPAAEAALLAAFCALLFPPHATNPTIARAKTEAAIMDDIFITIPP
jgi:hypothetical protein